MSEHIVKRIVARAIESEGGYRLVNDSDDRGGMTYAGISRVSWPRWPGWDLVDRGQHPRQQVVDFYRDNFVRPLRLDIFPDETFSETLFNAAIMSGTATTVRGIQRAVRKDVAVDGIMGPETIDAIMAMLRAGEVYTENLILRFFAWRSVRYAKIAHDDSSGSQDKFLPGWILRAARETLGDEI